MLAFDTIETARVRAHIAGAEALMHSRPVDYLNETQQLARSLLLEELAAYRERGSFPRNRDFERMMPYFIDGDGVRCAMAHLLEVGGRPDLVAKISRERNNAYVAELADEPELLEWLDAAGITVEEAARIQPSYCPIPPADRFCNGGPFTVIETTVMSPAGYDGATQKNVPAELRVNVVHGGGPDSPKPGNTVEAFYGTKIGSDVILRVPPNTPTRQASEMKVEEDATVKVDLDAWTSSGGQLSITKAKAIEASTSKDCAAILEKEDPRWTENRDPDCSSSDSIGPGCNAGAASPSTGLTLAIIAMVLATRAFRKR